MTKIQKILLGVLAAQIVLILVIYWPKNEQAEAKVFLNFDVENVEQIQIEDAVDHLAISRSGETWVLPEIDEYPVKSDTVTSLLESIYEISIIDTVAQSASSQQTLKVAADNFEQKVTLVYQDGESTVVYFGTSPSTTNIHARLGDSNVSYLVSGISSYSLSTKPANWVDTVYQSFDADTVTKFEIVNGNGKYVFEKDAVDGEWLYQDMEEGETLNSDAITNIVAFVENLRMIEPLGKENQTVFGLDDPQVKVEIVLRQEDGTAENIQLMIGTANTAGDAFYMKTSQSDYHALLANTNAEKLMRFSEEQFIQTN
jgi:hypothetical protein